MGESAGEEPKMTSSVSVVAGVPSGYSGKGSLAQLIPSSSRQANPTFLHSYVNLLAGNEQCFS